MTCKIPVNILPHKNAFNVCNMLGAAKSMENFILMEPPLTEDILQLFLSTSEFDNLNTEQFCVDILAQENIIISKQEFDDNFRDFQNRACSMPQQEYNFYNSKSLQALNKMCLVVPLDNLIGYAHIPDV